MWLQQGQGLCAGGRGGGDRPGRLVSPAQHCHPHRGVQLHPARSQCGALSFIIWSQDYISLGCFDGQIVRGLREGIDNTIEIKKNPMNAYNGLVCKWKGKWVCYDSTIREVTLAALAQAGH